MRFIYTKTFGIFAACLIAVAFFVFLEVKGLLNPIKNLILHSPKPVVFVVKKMTLQVKGFFSTVYKLRDISKENGLLTNKVMELEHALVQFEQEKKENEALRKELGFVRGAALNLAPCSVLSQNISGLSDTIVLNCGTDQGVSDSQAVVSQGYLVGKILHAGKTSSTALLATSSKFLTDAKLSKTGEDGIVKGSFGSGLFLEQLSQHSQFQNGWLVVTAGINEKIPKNITIGEVGQIISNENDLFARATLLSPIDFNNLEFVFVVK
jgi:rod shape-determining protein MreC